MKRSGPISLWALTALLCLLAMLVGAVGPAMAQTSQSGTVVGQVTDPTGAVVPGATVTMTDVTTNTPRTVTTNDAGRYLFVNVNPGTYDISVAKNGFAVAKVPQQVVDIGLTRTVNVALQVGGEKQEVVVEATGAELQTMNATVGNTLNSLSLQSLPSIGGEVSTFVAMQPGVAPDGSVAGAVLDQSTFQLDGGNNTNDMDGSMQVYTPSFGGDPTGGIAAGGGLRGGGNSGGVPTGVMPTPSDSVEEFKVNTANQTADFNSSAGAQVQIATKRGTNSFHGSAYEYYLDNNFNANTWDNNLSNTPNPSFHYNRFGVAAGGPITNKEWLGGKWYAFGNYQGFRWPNSGTIERTVPSANLKNGILTIGGVNYNLTTLDPRGIGLNPTVAQLWSSLPAGNDPGCTGTAITLALSGSRCDGVNFTGFKANMSLPQNDNFGVVRLDHDFGSKWHFMSSYRDYNLQRSTVSQFNISGGVPVATSARPQQPWYYVAGMTTNITPNVTNDFHYSFLRNWWQWGSQGDPPQIAGLGGALEPLGEQHYLSPTPYNVDTQNTRTRFWDGKDHFLRDDLSMLKGNHLFQFGGSYQHNFNFHQRTDNGGGINYYTVYQLGDSAGAGLVNLSSIIPGGLTASQTTTFSRDVAAAFGIVTDSQVAYTRTGANLALNPPLTPAFDQSTIPYYNVYFSDTWHMKPTFTLTYGLGWALEMPPVEANGKQVSLVDQSGQQVEIESYLHQRQAAALQGQVFNPALGYALVGNTGAGLKYPYDPFYGEFSPRIAAAWNPNIRDGLLGKLFGGNNTVVRAGYSRIYGRLNGVDLVLVPLLGTGLMQPVQCRLALSNGACGPTIPTATTAFRIGVDGNTAPLPAASPTLPQPLFPGINDVSAAAGQALDPHFRPNDVDGFDLTIQRQLSNKMTLEVGYIGRLIHHEYQPINTNAVPYMMTLGGQRFDQAYAALETQMGCATSVAACGGAGKAALVGSVTPQPFFEAALSGTGFCNGFSSCTAALVSSQFNNLVNQQVWSMWSALDQGGVGGGPGGTTVPGWNFARSMLNSPLNSSPLGANGEISGGVADNASVGHGNYHGGFVSVRMNDWRGVTLQSNFTYSKALGTGSLVQATSEFTPNDPFNLDLMYGPQNFDRKFVYNLFMVYQPPFYRSQQGAIGRLLGGWNFSPIFTAGSGAPLPCNTPTDAQSYGSADGANFFTDENCVISNGMNVSTASVHGGVAGGLDAFGNQIGTATAGSTPAGQLNIFADPVAVWNAVRPPILGIDKRDGGFGIFRNLPYWNVDLSVRKDLKLTERLSTEFQFMFLNVLNHNQLQLANTSLDISQPANWGVITAQGNTPRQMEFGVRLKW